MKRNEANGGRAFPVSGVLLEGEMDAAQYGMTLRDYFAAAALPAAVQMLFAYDPERDPAVLKPRVVKVAFGLAEAMLAERAKRPPV